MRTLLFLWTLVIGINVLAQNGESETEKTYQFKSSVNGINMDSIENKKVRLVCEGESNVCYLLGGEIDSMPKEKFYSNTEQIYRRFKGYSVQAYTVPFRLRGIGSDNFDFESSLSLQGNFVVGWGRLKSQRSFIDFSLGIGLTKVELNNLNSNVVDNRSSGALTISFGGVFKPIEKANIGVFLGWDLLGASDRDVDWIYNSKPWIGIGINIGIQDIIGDKPVKETD